MQVIGHDTQVDKSFAQFGQHVGTVINPTQQYRLIQHHDARVDEPSQGLSDGVVQFGRMVGVDNDDRRQARAGKPGEQFVADALGNDDRQPCVNAQSAHMGDRGQSFGQGGQEVVDQHQRISARKQYLVQRTIGRDLCQRRLPSGKRFGASA